LKNIMKEETYPGAAYMPLFILAPALSFIPALMTMAVIPFGAPWYSRWGLIDMSIAPLPIGFLYILAISSLGVYGIVLAGWSSNNKYALLGGLRSSAQMISYEIAMGMSTIPVLLLAGNVTLSKIVNQQAFETWNVLNLTIAFFIFLIAAFTFLKTFLTLGCFATKVLFFVFLYMWIRWTLPRFRYDQLMSLGWKFLLPLALGYIVAIATTIVTLDALGFARGSVPFHLG